MGKKVYCKMVVIRLIGSGFLISGLLMVSSCKIETSDKDLAHKVGQMLMVGFRDTTLTDDSPIISDIEDLGIGGVIIYEYDGPTKSRPRNITSKKQLSNLNRELQAHSKVPLFIGIDEEGGLVSRLKTKYDFLPTVSPQYLGTLNNADSSQFYAQRIAEACHSVGVNLNFAPLVDVNVNTDCPVIGRLGRSYSGNSGTVVVQAEIFIKEHLIEGVWCSLKHFPGHGSAKADSHKGFTDVTDTWSLKELKPYRQMISDSLCPMVMTAHVFNRNLDSVYPATLSKNTLDLLRKGMSYDGLILSDDMMMLAIADHFGLEESLEKAINAGVDVLLFSNNIDRYDPDMAQKVMETILNLVANGKVSEARIDESYQRIMHYKQSFK